MKHKFSLMWRVAVTLVLVLSFSLVMAVPVSAEPLTGVSAFSPSYTAGQTVTYTITFITATAATVKYVDIDFHTGFDVTNAALAETATGIGAGDVESSGKIVTYTVTTPAEIAGGKTIVIKLSGIVNPTSATTYTPTVTTMDIHHNLVDSKDVDSDVTITAKPTGFAVDTQGTGTEVAGTAFYVTVTSDDNAYTGWHLITFTLTGTGSCPDFEMLDFGTSGNTATTEASFILTKTSDSPIIIATDSELVISGTKSGITVNPGAVDYLTMTGAPISVIAGAPFSDDIIVTAYDACGNVVTTGGEHDDEIAWTSTDALATAGAGATTGLPVAANLAAGTVTFTGSDFILKTVGSQTITATDAAVHVAKTSDSITVSRTFTNQLIVTADPTSITADGTTTSTITAKACDQFGNVDTSYTEAVTSFETSLGTLSGKSTEFAAGLATATLTSTHTGTATIKVTSPSFQAITTVPLGGDVWVATAIDGGDSGNPGTQARPFDAIQDGINAAGEGGTVNVLPGTYTLGAAWLSIDKAGITVQSTGTAAETIIDGTAVTGGPVIYIRNSEVTFGGFTVTGATVANDGIVINYDTQGVTVQNNTITGAGKSGIALAYDYAGGPGVDKIVDGATVSGNTITGGGATGITTGISMSGCAKDCTISNNIITDCGNTGRGISFNGGTLLDPTQGNIITGNTISNNACMGIFVKMNTAEESPPYFDNNLISGNTISGNALSGIEIQTGLTITDLTITGNDITGNTLDGILIASWGSTNAINYNNIYGNDTAPSATIYQLNNGTATSVDAENNWWGNAVESAIEDFVSINVDYSPWLDALYPYGGSTTADGSAFILESGWNLISLSLIPTDSTIATVLADLITAETVLQVRTYDQGTWYTWASTEPHGNLTIMKDGPSYWVEMNATDDLTFTGSELSVPPYSPPFYDVYIGWNMIGFKSITTQEVATYLGTAIAGSPTTVQAIYGYDAAAGVYFIPKEIETPGVPVPLDEGLHPGYGYWLAVSANGTIYP